MYLEYFDYEKKKKERFLVQTIKYFYIFNNRQKYQI